MRPRRYSLNIKGIPYRTVWVEFPDIEPLCKKIGAPASMKRRDGTPLYTLPVIFDPNTGATVAESGAIALYLDKAYPGTVALVPRGTEALHAAFQQAAWTVLGTTDMAAITVPRAMEVVRERSAAFYRETREKWWGKIEEMAPPGSAKRKRHWEAVGDAYHKIAGWLDAGAGEGEQRLFFLGEGREKVCFADLFVAGFLKWVLYGEDSEEWQDVLRWDGGRWGRFVDG